MAVESWVAAALILSVLSYAAVKDVRWRIIPDRVHVMLLFIGLLQAVILAEGSSFYIAVSDRIFGFFIPAGILFFIYIFNDRMGGGDYKLIVSMGFCLGMEGLTVILLGTCISSGIYCLIKREKWIPLAPCLLAGAVFYIVAACAAGQ